VEYASQKDYAKHLEQEHEQGTGSSNLSTMLDIGETTSNDTSRVCPLCLVEETSSDRFYNHIAFHLESIAAFSLPRNTAGPEDDMESVHTASTNANRGSHGSESFETLSAFEEEPQRLSEVGEEAVSLTLQMLSSCVKGYQVISEARNLPEDARYLQVRLKIEGRRLINWAEVVGLTEERYLSSSVNNAREVLNRKEELLSSYVKLEMQSSTEPTTVDDVKDKNEDELSLLAKLPRIATETSRRFPDKVMWAFLDTRKFHDLIKKLSSLNDYLMELLTDQQRNKLDAVEKKTGTEIRESYNKLETLLNNMGARLEVDQTLREPRPENPRGFQTPNLKHKDERGDDIQSLNQNTALIEYGADPVYATGFEKDQIPRLPANTDESASDDEALPHRAPSQRVKFSASGGIESDVEYLEVASDISSMPPDDNQPIGPDEVGPSIPSENVSSPRITLQAPRDLSALETPFVNAVLQGDKPSARRILENSIFPRLKDYDLRDAINVAVENEDCMMVEMLLDVGEANGKRRHSWRSLHTAARKGNKKLVELLVQKGVAVNVKSDDDGSNPLHQAAKYGHKQVVDRLMSLAVVTQDGSGVDEVDCNGMLPLHFAARHAHETTAGTLIMASDVNQQNNHGRTPLIEATRNGADKIVKLLLGNGADVNSKDEEGKTALHEVVNNGNTLIFDMLLAAGADVDSKTSFGFTPLHYVFNHKETTIARMLLEKGADVNARTANGETPLHLVAGVPKQHRLVNLFLREGADPNLVSHPFGLDAYERQSPLRTACAVLGNVETVRVLIEGGADINADTVRTGTALQAACQSGDSDIVNLLIEVGAFVGAPRPLAPSPLQEAARNGHLEIVQLLLNKDADIDEQSDVLGTALEAACRGNHRSIAEFLIRQGANLTARDAFGQRDKYGRTCVDLAIAQDDIGFAQFLVKTIQDTLGFEHRETLAAEEKLKSALESRDDIEGHSSELQQRTSRGSGDSDSDSGLIFPRHRLQSSKERVHEDTNTLSSDVLQAREILLQAMERPDDRSLLLRHEIRILRFINSVESM
jgi:ankyrin repeat protein